MRDNVVLPLIAVAIIVLVIGTTAYVLYSEDDSGEGATGISSSDLIDRWYVSMEMVYTEDNVFEKNYPNTKPSLGNMSIDIYELEGMSFYGSYMDKPLTGVISGSVFRMYSDYGGEYVTSYAYLLNSNTFFSIFGDYSYDANGNIIGSSIHLLAYTKDPSRPVTDPGFMDVLGNWTNVVDSVARDKVFGKMGYGDMVIDYQNENIFAGNWLEGGSTVREFKGAMFSNGTNYISIIAGERYITISTISPSGVLSGTVSTMADGETVATTLTYVREGTHASPSETGLVGTSWGVIDSSSLGGKGEITHTVKYYTISFTDEKDGVIVGDWYYGNETSTLAGTAISTGNAGSGVSLNLVWYEADKGNTSRTGYIDNNGNIILSTLYSNPDGSIVARSYTLQKIEPSTTNLVGHWYLTREIGYEGDNYFDRTAYDTPSISHNDLDIYGLENGQFYGMFTGKLIVGSYLDGVFISEDVDVDGYICTIYRWIESDNTMTMLITGMKEGDDVPLSLHCTYSKTRGSVTALKAAIDIMGSWTAIKPFSMDVGGTVRTILGTNLNITEQHETSFKGTMEQMSGSSMVTYDIIGVFLITTWGTTQGNIIDERGVVWNIQFVNDSLMLNAVDISHISPIADEMNGIERRYIRTGSEDKGYSYPDDISGRTFGSENMDIMTVLGEQQHLDCDLEITISYQNNNLLSGTFNETINDCSGTFIAHILNNVGQPMYRIEFSDNLHDDTYYGMGWIYYGNIYLETNSEIDGTVYQFTTKLEEVVS